MAKSPSHKFGQIIGDLLERTVEPLLRECLSNYSNLFLDSKGPRKARNNKKKVSWQDKYGNIHDLDYVIELNGTKEEYGSPVAFIESAWRRYTKHSRNKAQEIQGAVRPLQETFSQFCPFAGAIIGGVFTGNSIDQLISHGFKVLYFDYDSIIEAFASVGLNASFDESTSVRELKGKISAYNKLSKKRINLIEQNLLKSKDNEIKAFIDDLNKSLSRQIEIIVIIPLHGLSHSISTAKKAIEFIENYNLDSSSHPFMKFEILIKFNNGDKIEASFHDNQRAFEFLSNYT